MHNLRAAEAEADRSGQGAAPSTARHAPTPSKLSPAQAVMLGRAFEQVSAGPDHTRVH